MHRRKSLEMLGGLSAFPLIFHKRATGRNFDSAEWQQHFKVRWNNSRTYCYEVYEIMPASEFSFAPHPELKSFGELFIHIGNGLHIYASVLDGSDPAKEIESGTKDAVAAYLNNGFTNFTNAIDHINSNDLYEIKHPKAEVDPWKDFSIFDIITLGYNHTVHHIAQATVYLRINDLKPPRYRF